MVYTMPVGFAAGMLAATIAVGGFVGVPGMIYVVGASSIIAYVKDHMIKIVMGTIMLLVAVSRGLAIPKYLDQLGLVSMNSGDINLMTKISFGIMCFALVTGAVIILGSMWKARSPRFATEESYGKA